MFEANIARNVHTRLGRPCRRRHDMWVMGMSVCVVLAYVRCVFAIFTSLLLLMTHSFVLCGRRIASKSVAHLLARSSRAAQHRCAMCHLSKHIRHIKLHIDALICLCSHCALGGSSANAVYIYNFQPQRDNITHATRPPLTSLRVVILRWTNRSAVFWCIRSVCLL